jgi:hypothetical protein
MSDRELKLNSISRSSKQSPRLVLEEHGHCEVPAGCGGVVLRWRGHNDPIPVKLFIFARGEYAVFLDGDALSSARPLVAPGEHVLAFRLERPPAGKIVLMFAAVADEKNVGFRASPPVDPIAPILSLPDGSWRCSTQEPPDDAWARPGYDDAAWSPMTREREPVVEQRSMDAYWIRRLQDLGAQPIGIQDRAHAVWVRKEFALVSRGKS